jgi:hypothetical protein
MLHIISSGNTSSLVVIAIIFIIISGLGEKDWPTPAHPFSFKPRKKHLTKAEKTQHFSSASFHISLDVLVTPYNQYEIFILTYMLVEVYQVTNYYIVFAHRWLGGVFGVLIDCKTLVCLVQACAFVPPLSPVLYIVCICTCSVVLL